MVGMMTGVLGVGNRLFALTGAMGGLAVSLLVAAAPAAAQLVPGAPAPTPVRDNDDDPLRAGPGLPGVGGYPGRGLQLRFDILGRYEDNLGRRQAADSGYRLRPQAAGSYGLGLGQQGLFINASVARDIFVDVPNLQDRDRFQVGAGLDYRLSRCSGTTGAGWQRSLMFQSDASAFGGFEQERTSFGITASCRISGALGLNGSVLRSIVSTETGFGAAFDLSNWTYSAGLSFGSAGIGQFSLTASQTDSIMPGRQVLTQGGLFDDGLRQRSLRLGFNRGFGSKINLSLGLSYLDTQPNFAEQVIIIDNVPQLVPRDSFSGAGFDAALDFNLSPRLGFQLTAGRSSFANPQVGAQFTIATNYAAIVNFRLSGTYALQAGVTRRENRYRGGFASPLDPFIRVSDDLDRVFGQISARLGRRLRLAFDVTHNRRRSNPSILNFSSTGVGLNLGFDLGRGQS